MRGLPGSGKSFYVKSHFPQAVVCSADSFYEQNGTYNFDPTLIGEAHNSCFKKFKKAVLKKEPLIVVDNTNTKAWEFSHYFEYAEERGYSTQVIRIECPVAVCIERNSHNVPARAIEAMAERMNSSPLDEIIPSTY
jgi:predicted kinase